MTTTDNTAPTVEHGTTVLIPLNKLKKHPKNARKIPHSEASIEAKAASIAAKGILQNLVVEPETDADGEPTGFYLVSIGEGRRQAQMLRVKRKQIKKTEPIRCVIDTANDAAEISLDENVTREDLHPADQFERFRELSEDRRWGAEEIAARFGATAHVVKQRMRLGAVSPKLLQVYRDGDLTLDKLKAFAITDDHARQEHVYENLSYNRDPSIIRRDLTKMNVPATDRCAVFVGPEAYAEAGGTIIRDLFTEDRGGFLEDPALLDRLAVAKLEGIAAEVQQAEGWKWTAAYLDFPHAHGMRSAYRHPVELSEADAIAYGAAQDELEHLNAEWQGADVDLPAEVDARLAELEAEIERIDAKRHAFDPDDIARGGLFVVVAHNGDVRIERGFIRAEDEAAGKTATDQKTKARGRARVRGGPGTALRTVGLLGGIFSHAVRRRIVDANPVRGLDKRFADKRRTRALTPDEYARIGAALREKAEHPSAIAAIRFLALSGFRKGEAQHLLRTDVHPDLSIIALRDSKTGPQSRPIGQSALNIVAVHPAGTGPHVFWGLKTGKPFIGIPKVFERICKIADLADVTLHTLRHSFASVAAELGYSEFVIAGLLGHRIGSITARYSHLPDKALVAAANVVSLEVSRRLGSDDTPA